MDPGYLPSSTLTLSITIESVNDEVPRLTSDLTHFYVEGSGPIALLSPTATLYDDDNCPEHRLVSEIRLVLDDLLEGEDSLLVQEIECDNGSLPGLGFSGFGSGLGEWTTEVSGPLYTFSCDQGADTDWYNRFLRGLQYTNTADEPTPRNRTITLEVSLPHTVLVTVMYSTCDCRLKMWEVIS